MPDFKHDIKNLQSIPVPQISGDGGAASFFNNLGTGISVATGIADNMIKKDIRNEAQSIFDSANKEFTDLPADIEQSGKSFERLHKAYKQGKLSDTAYYSKLVAGTKKLKSKYPGYLEQIDNTIRNVTGVRPANALRKATLKELDALFGSEEAKREDFLKFVSKQGNMEVLGLRFPDVLSNPDKYLNDPSKMEEVYQYTVSQHGEKAALQRKLSEYNLLDKQDDFERKDIEVNVSRYSNAKVTESISGLNRLMEEQYGENIYEVLMKGNTLDTESLNQIVSHLKLRRDSLYAQLQGEIIEVSQGKIDQRTVETQLSSAMKPFDDLIDNVVNKEFGVAGMSARSNQIIKDRELNDLLENDNISFYNSLKDISPDLYDKMLQTPGGARFRNSLESTLNAIALDNINLGEASLEDTIKGMVDSKTSRGLSVEGAMNLTIKDLSTQLGDLQGSKEQWDKVFEKVYTNSDIFKYFGDKSQIDIYKTLTNSKITERVFSSNDPDKIKKYYDWVVSQPLLLGDFRKSANDVNTIQNTRSFLKGNLSDDGKIHISIDEKEFDKFRENNTTASRATMVKSIKNTLDYVDNFNDILSSIVPIIGRVGNDPKEVIGSILSGASVDLNSRQDSWLQWIADFAVEDEDESGQLAPGSENNPVGIEFKKWIQNNPEWLSVGPPKLETSSHRGYKPDVDNLKPELKTKVKSLQDLFDKDLPIISGFRDSKRNTITGGAKNSRHMHGDAIDIDVRHLSKQERLDVIKKAKTLGFKGVGIYPNSLHFDLGKERAWGPTHKKESIPDWAKEAL